MIYGLKVIRSEDILQGQDFKEITLDGAPLTRNPFLNVNLHAEA